MQKILNNRLVKAVCNLCLALSAAIAISNVSLIIYGEPEYPTQE